MPTAHSPPYSCSKALSQLRAVLVGLGQDCVAEKVVLSLSMERHVLISPPCATKPALGEFDSSSHQSDLLRSHCSSHSCREIHSPHTQSLRRSVSVLEITKSKTKSCRIHHDHVCRLPLGTAWAANQPVPALVMPAGLCGEEDTPALKPVCLVRQTSPYSSDRDSAHFTLSLILNPRKSAEKDLSGSVNFGLSS